MKEGDRIFAFLLKVGGGGMMSFSLAFPLSSAEVVHTYVSRGLRSNFVYHWSPPMINFGSDDKFYQILINVFNIMNCSTCSQVSKDENHLIRDPMM